MREFELVLFHFDRGIIDFVYKVEPLSVRGSMLQKPQPDSHEQRFAPRRKHGNGSDAIENGLPLWRLN